MKKNWAALAGAPATATELSKQLGTNRSTALRLVRGLVAAGWVIQDAEHRYVAGGPKLWHLLQTAPDQVRVRAVVDPMLAKIRDDVGEAAAFAIQVGEVMVYTSFFPSGQDIGLLERIGSSRPMHCSALGKAFLAGLPPDAAEREIGRLSFSGGTPRAPRSPDALAEVVSIARIHGYALDLEETLDGAHCVAVPIIFAGTVWGSAGVQGPASRLPEGRLREIGERLSAMAAGQQASPRADGRVPERSA